MPTRWLIKVVVRRLEGHLLHCGARSLGVCARACAREQKPILPPQDAQGARAVESNPPHSRADPAPAPSATGRPAPAPLPAPAQSQSALAGECGRGASSNGSASVTE